jgi:hypothetical protein
MVHGECSNPRTLLSSNLSNPSANQLVHRGEEVASFTFLFVDRTNWPVLKPARSSGTHATHAGAGLSGRLHLRRHSLEILPDGGKIERVACAGKTGGSAASSTST